MGGFYNELDFGSEKQGILWRVTSDFVTRYESLQSKFLATRNEERVKGFNSWKTRLYCYCCFYH